DVLPLLGYDAGPNGVDERVAEHRHEIVVFQDPALDLLGQPLTLGGIDRSLVLLELGVEILHADAVACVEAAALDEGLVPEGPAPRDPGRLEDDPAPGPALEPALQPLQVDASLHGLEPGPDADLAKLGDDPLAAGVERRHRGDPVHLEAVR